MPQRRSNASGSRSSSSGRASSRSGSAKRSASGSASAKRSTPASGAAKRSTPASGAAKRSSASTRSRSAASSRARASNASRARTGASRASSDGADPRVEAVAQRVRKLNERIIEVGREAGETTLAAYERALKAIATSMERGAGRSDIEWVSQLMTAQAKFIRDVTSNVASAARGALR